MRILAALSLIALIAPGLAGAQGVAVIDLNAKPRAFSKAQYDEMVACTLKTHPDETRRYAEYHLNRRDVQTPEQNERDPDSKLMFPALEGCFEIANGEVFPFALDALIRDWGRVHGITRPQPVALSEEELAKCIWAKAPREAEVMATTKEYFPFIQNMTRATRVCDAPNGQVDIERFQAAMRNARPGLQSDGRSN